MGRGLKQKRFAQKNWLPYALILPGILVVSAVTLYPMIRGVVTSLYQMNLMRMFESSFVGFDNYKNIFLNDPFFRGALWATLRWTVTVVMGQMLIALPVALFLNMNFRGRGFVRMIVLLPWVVPPAVVAIIFVYMFDGNFGVVNELMVRLGLISSYQPWLAMPLESFLVVILAGLWTGFPFMTIMLLAALQGLPQDIYEAARVDGAGPWRSFYHVTLPQLMPTILLLLLLRTLWWTHSVDLIYLMTDGGPGTANYTLAVYSFKLTAVRLEVGYASAIAVILALILLVFALLYLRQIEKSQEYMQ